MLVAYVVVSGLSVLYALRNNSYCKTRPPSHVNSGLYSLAGTQRNVICKHVEDGSDVYDRT